MINKTKSMYAETRNIQIEGNLEYFKEKLKMLLEHVPTAYYLVSVDGNIIYCNKAVKELVGYDQEELMGKDFLKLKMFPESQFAKTIKGLFKNKSGYCIEPEKFTINRKDGKRVIIEVRTLLVNIEGGTFILGIANNITKQNRTGEVVGENAKRYWQLAEFLPNAMVVCSKVKIVFANTMAVKLAGATGAGEIIGKHIVDFVPHEYLKIVNKRVNQVLEKGKDIHFINQKLVRPDGTIIDTEVSAAYMLYRGEGAVLFVIKDITERMRVEEELYFERACFRELFNSSPDAIVVLNNEGRIIIVNNAFSNLFQYSNEEIRGLHINDLVVPDDLVQEAANLFGMVMNGEIVDKETIRKCKDGTRVDVTVRGYPVMIDGEQVGIYAIYSDITKRKKAERTVNLLCYYDSLTGLSNRVLFKKRFSLELVHAQESKQMLAVIILDLDKFKNINDSLGHSIGDKLLIEAAERLKNIIREIDTLSRLGGDEFILLLSELPGIEDAANIAKKILDAFQQPFIIEGYELYITTSIGVSIYPNDGSDVETMIKNADTAMYRAKDHGGNSCQFYTKNMNKTLLEQMKLLASLRRAVEREEFEVYYQPRISAITGKINGMEALIRWIHPEQGLICPTQFIPLAEDTGLIVPIGEWVLRNACAQNRAWQDAGFYPLRVAVNLSAQQFQQPSLVNMIDGILKETGLEPEYLELEITESAVAHNMEFALKMIRQLKEMGIHISMDDFGTGYSCFSQLKNMNIDILKIDQSFIRDINTNNSDLAIVRSIISMAHSLDMKVTAEGVETANQFSLLKEIECDAIQGYLFGKPLPAGEFQKLFKN